MLYGRYELVAPIGEGTTAVVWQAHDRERGIPVALKRFRPEVALSPELAACARAEATLCSRMLSPHVVRVLDSAPDSSEYIAYELLEGETLAARLEREGPLPLSVVRDVVVQVCSALARMHSLGIAHRDVKPGNIFLVPREGGRFVV
jgi:serine/threonine protein kinase